MMPYLYRSFSAKALWLAALLRKMTCNLRRSLSLHHPVQGFYGSFVCEYRALLCVNVGLFCVWMRCEYRALWCVNIGLFWESLPEKIPGWWNWSEYVGLSCMCERERVRARVRERERERERDRQKRERERERERGGGRGGGGEKEGECARVWVCSEFPSEKLRECWH